MSIRTEGAGTHGTMLPFPLGSKVGSDVDMSKNLGQVVEGKFGRKFRLVQYIETQALAGPYAAGANVAGARHFAPKEPQMDDPTTMYKVSLAVRGGTKPNNRSIGVALKDQDALVEGDYFWLQFDGDYIDMFLGDDVTALATGDYVALDDDADLGCIYSLGTTFTPEFMVGVALDDDPGADTIVRVRPHHPLNG